MHTRWVALTATIAKNKEKVRQASGHMEKWALVANEHKDAGRKDLAVKAFKKALFWERRLEKLKGQRPGAAPPR